MILASDISITNKEDQERRIHNLIAQMGITVLFRRTNAKRAWSVRELIIALNVANRD